MKFSEYYMMSEVSEIALNKAKEKFIQQGEDNNEVETIVNKFNELEKKHLTKGIDLFKIRFQELKDFITNSQESKTVKKKEVKSSGADKVYEDSQYILYKILTKEAACLYGKGTKWCISAKENNMFDEYKNIYSFYFLIDKTKNENDPLYKIAFSVGRPDVIVYNAEDIELNNYVIPEKIRPFLKKDEYYVLEINSKDNKIKYVIVSLKGLLDIKHLIFKNLNKMDLYVTTKNSLSFTQNIIIIKNSLNNHANLKSKIYKKNEMQTYLDELAKKEKDMKIVFIYGDGVDPKKINTL